MSWANPSGFHAWTGGRRAIRLASPTAGSIAALSHWTSTGTAPNYTRPSPSTGRGGDWTYLPYGPYASEEEFLEWAHSASRSNDPLFFAIVDLASGKAAGIASYLRITPARGSIEVGHIHYSPLLQGKTAGTEAMYLMMKHAFEPGYRRYEWKCDSLNSRSRAAALRLGFTFKGIFRQATVYKGRNRDTAWYSVIDREWPALERAFRCWLHPDNFDEFGRQRRRLEEVRRSLVGAERRDEEKGER